MIEICKKILTSDFKLGKLSLDSASSERAQLVKKLKGLAVKVLYSLLEGVFFCSF